VATNEDVIALGRGVNPNHAEDVIRRFAEVPGSLRPKCLDLSACVHIDASVGWRIGNAIRRHGNASLLRVLVPDRDEASSAEWFLQFTRTGLGQSVAYHCDQVYRGKTNVASRLREYYQRIEGKPAQNHVFVSNIRDRRPFNVDRFDSFFASFRSSLPFVGVKDGTFSGADLEHLATFVFEGIQNIYDHAHNSPLPGDTRVFDYLCLNFFNKINPPPDPSDRLSTYCRRITSRFPATTRLIGFLELVVSDDGVGIAARQRQDAGIYWQPDVRGEDEALHDALRSGSSVKFRSQDSPIRHDPGYGIAKIVASLLSIRAFATLRTGRRLAFFDGSDEATGAFSLAEEVLGYMPGTTLDVLVPIPDTQLRLAGMS
jgi:hypothetical protein